MPSCKQILPDSRKPWVGPVLVARDALPPLPGPARRAESREDLRDLARDRTAVAGRRRSFGAAGAQVCGSRRGRTSAAMVRRGGSPALRGGLGPWVPGTGSLVLSWDGPLGERVPDPARARTEIRDARGPVLTAAVLEPPRASPQTQGPRCELPRKEKPRPATPFPEWRAPPARALGPRA